MGKPAMLSRAERKTTKRKLEDAIPDLPGDENGMDVDVDVEGEGRNKKRKIEGGDGGKGKKGKKEVANEEVDEEKEDGDGDGGGVNVTAEGEGEEAPRKSKKERKAERRAKELAAKAAEGAGNGKIAEAEVKGDDGEETKTKTEVEKTKGGEGKIKEGKEKKKVVKNPNKEPVKGEAAKGDGKPPRFIVFIGNLPFTTTKTSLQAHFSSVKPTSIRLLTHKLEPTKCKGCAFLEFSSWDTMKTCLKLFHHSMFDDKISPARKINVELTAGGGGNGGERKKKIEGKNRGLNEERGRRAEVEAKKKGEKKEEEKKEGGEVDGGESGVHPSRRGIVNKGGRGR